MVEPTISDRFSQGAIVCLGILMNLTEFFATVVAPESVVFCEDDDQQAEISRDDVTEAFKNGYRVLIGNHDTAKAVVINLSREQLILPDKARDTILSCSPESTLVSSNSSWYTIWYISPEPQSSNKLVDLAEQFLARARQKNPKAFAQHTPDGAINIAVSYYIHEDIRDPQGERVLSMGGRYLHPRYFDLKGRKRRFMSYLRKIKSEAKDYDSWLFRLAAIAVRGFEIPDSIAIAILKWYIHDTPWIYYEPDEKDLVEKIRRAHKSTNDRYAYGYMLRGFKVPAVEPVRKNAIPLKQYAEQENISYQAAWQRSKRNQINTFKTPGGKVFVCINDEDQPLDNNSPVAAPTVAIEVENEPVNASDGRVNRNPQEFEESAGYNAEAEPLHIREDQEFRGRDCRCECEELSSANDPHSSQDEGVHSWGRARSRKNLGDDACLRLPEDVLSEVENDLDRPEDDDNRQRRRNPGDAKSDFANDYPWREGGSKTPQAVGDGTDSAGRCSSLQLQHSADRLRRDGTGDGGQPVHDRGGRDPSDQQRLHQSTQGVCPPLQTGRSEVWYNRNDCAQSPCRDLRSF